MKTLRILLLLLVTPALFAQQPARISNILKEKRTQLDKLEITQSSTVTLLPIDFADAVLKSKLAGLAEMTIVKVYYVYTQYKRSATFNQAALDQKRFNQLAEDVPFLLNDPVIEWEIIEQTGCHNYTEGAEFFHGFILVHRPDMTAEQRAAEIRKLLDYMDHPEKEILQPEIDPIAPLLLTNVPEESTTKINARQAKFKEGDYALYQYLQKEMYPKEIYSKRDDVWAKVTFIVDRFGRIKGIDFPDEKTPNYIQDEISETLVNMPVWTPAERNGAPVESEVQMEIRATYIRNVNGMYTRDGERPSFMGEIEKNISESHGSYAAGGMDLLALSTVARGLKLIDSTEIVAIVMDVTGSMYADIASLKRWVDKNPDSLDITSYSFFNDGDNKETRDKKKGETGGIYNTSDPLKVRETIEEAMIKGSGGERSESDIEAILYALQHDSLCNAVLLVGDNYSEIRDLSLLELVNKKVNVLICGAPTTIRVDYLELVQNTGGYLLMNGRKYNLTDLKSGDSVIIEKHLYKFTGRKFKYEGKVPQ
jgi:hypothetical protein